MPRTNSRKRNNHRNDNTARVSTASNLSPNAPEFIPNANDDSVSIPREYLEAQPIPFFGNSTLPNSSGNNSSSNSIETTRTVRSLPNASNESQRDLLTNLLNECKVDCVICYERAKNVEQIWNCRNCFQIMHLKCVMVWFIKSQLNGSWRCPACQSEVAGKPDYKCFCGTLKNPYSNSVDIPHSCGQICGLNKKNTNVEYNTCHHKCTLLCHPGPCPQCVVQVLRRCRCEKTEVYVQCGKSTPIVCQNICSKELNCKNHVCEKQCHIGNCDPCKKNCPQIIELMETNGTQEEFNSPLTHNSRFIIPIEHMVSEEELRMLGLDPEELLHSLNVESNDSENDIEDYVDDDDEINDDDNDDYEDVDDDDDYPDLITSSNHFARVFWPQPQTSGSENISVTVSSRNFPTVITNYLLHNSSTDDDNDDNYNNSVISVDSENSSSNEENISNNEENSMHSVSSEEYVQSPSSVDSASSMDSNGSHHFLTNSESSDDDRSFSSYSTIDLTSSNSSQNSLNYSEDSNSYSSTSDSSSHY